MFVHIILLISVLFIAMPLIAVNGNKLYYFEEKIKMTHFDANEVCKKMGMSLASIKSKQELEYLKEYLQQEYGHIYPYWLGAYKLDGQWIWIGSGEKIQKFFWHQGEPNNENGIENCIHTWEGHFDWNDKSCTLEKYFFICDVEASNTIKLYKKET
ncbi:hypothetical protein DOY81_012328 [Sarcophaga bullata]|nr:hypothetical protein DOY81_012328 [Sarcophaga bullata]